MVNTQKSKNTVLISNISIITFLNFAFYSRAASLLEKTGLGARGRFFTKTHEAKTETEADAKTHEASSLASRPRPEDRSRGLISRQLELNL